QTRNERTEQGESRRERQQEQQGAFSNTPRCSRAGIPQSCLTFFFLPSAGAEGQPSEERGRECSCPEEPRGGRRLRTAFSAEQISTLESSFQRHRYLGAAERRKLASRMRLSEVQVSTWFQNRRMKLKRQLQELRPEPFCTPPLPFGPQVSLPLTYVARPPPLPGHEAAPGSFALAALPSAPLPGGSYNSPVTPPTPSPSVPRFCGPQMWLPPPPGWGWRILGT
uniref:VENT homeobox n=1 Tax=Coturnix japonica TaxID=93934 RepID=A0A8C2UA36_COTJA